MGYGRRKGGLRSAPRFWFQACGKDNQHILEHAYLLKLAPLVRFCSSSFHLSPHAPPAPLPPYLPRYLLTLGLTNSARRERTAPS